MSFCILLRKLARVVVLLALVGGFARTAKAQLAGSATITGTFTDPAGADGSS